MAMRSGSTTSLPGRAELTTLQGHAASVVAQKGEIWRALRDAVTGDDNERRVAVVVPGSLLGCQHGAHDPQATAPGSPPEFAHGLDERPVRRALGRRPVPALLPGAAGAYGVGA